MRQDIMSCKKLKALGLVVSVLAIAACAEPEALVVDAVAAPAKTYLFSDEDRSFFKTASIYEVNVRQFSPAGTLSAVQQQLPRLKTMGVDVLWLMPIFPVGEERRKGELGSAYSVKHYRQVNPRFGDVNDVKALVDEAHKLGMVVILDWVANHTSFDHPWTKSHPEWYTQNAAGEIIDPIDGKTGKSWGWTDVADLNYDNKALWQAMADDMKFWLELGVDGFRCDVAAEVPVEFWQYTRKQLDAIRPVFMLAEAEVPELQSAFDMSYAWNYHHLSNDIAKGEKPAKATLDNYMAERLQRFDADHMLMQYTTNHDENSWAGTVYERYGKAHKAFAVLAFTLDGMPLVYSGQEAGLNKRLEFFKKDAIDWRDLGLAKFYQQLLSLKQDQPALWSGSSKFHPLDYQANNDKSYAFKRSAENSELVIAINISDQTMAFTMPEDLGTYDNVLGNAVVQGRGLTLAAHGYVILAKP